MDRAAVVANIRRVLAQFDGGTLALKMEDNDQTATFKLKICHSRMHSGYWKLDEDRALSNRYCMMGKRVLAESRPYPRVTDEHDINYEKGWLVDHWTTKYTLRDADCHVYADGTFKYLVFGFQIEISDRDYGDYGDDSPFRTRLDGCEVFCDRNVLEFYIRLHTVCRTKQVIIEHQRYVRSEMERDLVRYPKLAIDFNFPNVEG